MQLYKNFFKLVKANKISVMIASIIMLVYAVAMIVSAPSIVDKNEGSATEKSVDYKNLGVMFRDNDNSELSKGVRTLIDKYGSVEDTTASDERINDILYFSISDFYIDVIFVFQLVVGF